jgi:hypothetical protein
MICIVQSLRIPKRIVIFGHRRRTSTRKATLRMPRRRWVGPVAAQVRVAVRGRYTDPGV